MRQLRNFFSTLPLALKKVLFFCITLLLLPYKGSHADPPLATRKNLKIGILTTEPLLVAVTTIERNSNNLVPDYYAKIFIPAH